MSARVSFLAIVLLEQRAQAIVRERFDFVIVAADHVVIVDQSVDDCFFRCLHCRGEERIHSVVWNRFD